MTYEDQKKELYFANAVIGAIDNVKTPMLMYQEEKDVVRKALRMYIDRIDELRRIRRRTIQTARYEHAVRPFLKNSRYLFL